MQDTAYRWCVESCTEADQRESEEEHEARHPARRSTAARRRVPGKAKRSPAPARCSGARGLRSNSRSMNPATAGRPRTGRRYSRRGAESAPAWTATASREAEARVNSDRLLRRFEEWQEEDRRQQQRDDARGACDARSHGRIRTRRRELEKAVRRADEGRRAAAISGCPVRIRSVSAIIRSTPPRMLASRTTIATAKKTSGR